MAIPKEEDIKVRVPASMKAGIKKIADERFTSESEIARQAFVEYLQRHGVALRETGPAYKVNSSATSDEVDVQKLAAVVNPLSYSGAKPRLSPKARHPSARAAHGPKAAGNPSKSDAANP